MSELEKLRELIPDVAKDIRLNLGAVLAESSLSDGQKWGVAYATAIASRNPRVRDAIRAEAEAKVPAAVLEDARAAAALMGMNNVFYRFRHMVAKPGYGTLRAGLRMNRLVQPATSKVDFELMSLAVSAINGCEQCIQSHEKVVTDGGLSEQQVHDAIRIASVIHAAAIALEL